MHEIRFTNTPENVYNGIVFLEANLGHLPSCIPNAPIEIVLHVVQFSAAFGAFTNPDRLHWPKGALQANQSGQLAVLTSCKSHAIFDV